MSTHLKRISSYFKYRLFMGALFLLLAAVLFALLYSHVKPQVIHVELLSVADQTIRSPVTIEDEVRTEREKARAAAEIEEAFVYQKETANNQALLVGSLFDMLLESSKKIQSMSGDNQSLVQKEVDSLKKKMGGNDPAKFASIIKDEDLLILLSLTEKDLAQVGKVVAERVELALQKRIREEDVQGIQQEIERSILLSNLSEKLNQAAADIGRYAIVPNELYDEELTRTRKLEAMEKVEPVKILQGQVIVQEGHLVDRETYRQLELAGVLNNQASKRPLFGLAIFIATIVIMLYYYFLHSPHQEEKKNDYLLMTLVIFIFSLTVMKIGEVLLKENNSEVLYIVPAAFASMLLSVLVNERLAMLIAIMLSACGSILFNEGASTALNVEMAMYILFSSLSGILFLKGEGTKHILQAGLFVSLVNVCMVLFLKTVSNGQFADEEYMYISLFACISGLSSAVLTIGVLPFFDAGFGLLSSVKLIELSSPNHPLLRKMLVETPGTYHHSIMVANLSEAACEAIGANGLLARVGCYYHDVGKMKHPQFFIENQMNGRNPHDDLPPEVSKDIIISHVKDGVDILIKYELPKEIIEIAKQHHGTTLMKYFYFKAKKTNDEVVESEYRYSGPKPQTREIAVINIADSVEAAVRSMKQPTKQAIENLIEQIVQDRLNDGQFNECDITLKELQIVKKSLAESLNGLFHSRIEYPEFNKKAK